MDMMLIFMIAVCICVVLVIIVPRAAFDKGYRQWLEIIKQMPDQELWKEYEYFVRLGQSSGANLDTNERIDAIEEELKARGYKPDYKDFLD